MYLSRHEICYNHAQYCLELGDGLVKLHVMLRVNQG